MICFDEVKSPVGLLTIVVDDDVGQADEQRHFVVGRAGTAITHRRNQRIASIRACDSLDFGPDLPSGQSPPA